MVRLPRRCAVTGCREWALQDSQYCRAHSPQPAAPPEAQPEDVEAVRPRSGRPTRPAEAAVRPPFGPGARRGETADRAGSPARYGVRPAGGRRHPDGAGRAGQGLYGGVLGPGEWDELRRYIETQAAKTADGSGTLEEVAVMRTLIWRVMRRYENDPARALPLVRQGVDAICRALRTQRLLSGEGADSLSAAFAVALREIGEELGIDDPNG